MKYSETKKPVSNIFLILIFYPIILFFYFSYIFLSGPYCIQYPFLSGRYTDCFFYYGIAIPVGILGLLFLTIYLLNRKVETKANKYGPLIVETKKKKINPNTKIKI